MVADIWEGEHEGRRCRRVTIGCRRLPARTIKLAAVGSNRPTETADKAVGGGIRAAFECLLAAVAGRRRLVGLLKPAATESRRSNRTTSTAAGDGTRGTGRYLFAVTCGRRRAVKVKEINSPVATAAVASIPIAILYRRRTRCRQAGSVPISPAALGY